MQLVKTIGRLRIYWKKKRSRIKNVRKYVQMNQNRSRPIYKTWENGSGGLGNAEKNRERESSYLKQNQCPKLENMHP